MKLTYEQFLRHNKSITSPKTTIVSVKFKQNTCQVQLPCGTYHTVPINVIVLDMENGLGHINNASKLKNWSGWNTDIQYPANYFK